MIIVILVFHFLAAFTMHYRQARAKVGLIIPPKVV